MGAARTITLFTIALLSVTLAAFTSAQVPGSRFQDCPDCPQMVVVPAGSFIMGWSDNDPWIGFHRAVIISRPFAVGRYEVTRGEFAAFVRETGYARRGQNCWYFTSDERRAANDDASKSWRNPGFAQDDSHPVVCVSWHDAKAYASWLAKKTAHHYRLLTEAEWEYAARAGTRSARPSGSDPDAACEHANVRDRTFERSVHPAKGKAWPPHTLHNCDDGAAYTAKVGSYRANPFGLHDMIGNAEEWVEDCFSEWELGNSDGSAYTRDPCPRRVARGASWFGTPRYARLADRTGLDAGHRAGVFGFRVARTLTP